MVKLGNKFWNTSHYLIWKPLLRSTFQYIEKQGVRNNNFDNFYGCQTWSFTLKEKCNLRVPDNKVGTQESIQDPVGQSDHLV
jgi:hypothetical protein